MGSPELFSQITYLGTYIKTFGLCELARGLAKSLLIFFKEERDSPTISRIKAFLLPLFFYTMGHTDGTSEGVLNRRTIQVIVGGPSNSRVMYGVGFSIHMNAKIEETIVEGLVRGSKLNRR